MSYKITSQPSWEIPPISFLRWLVGFFYLPHVLSKITGFSGTVGFFEKAGFHPAPAFVIFSGAIELTVGLMLIFGIFSKYASLMSAALMFVAAYAVVAVNGSLWYWNSGGGEYLAFWCIASLIVFYHEWLQNPGLLGHPKQPAGH